MKEFENIKILKEEYESLTRENKQEFLKLVSKKNYRTLTEEQFWKNFTVICDYLALMGSHKDITAAAVAAGYYTYEYLNKRWIRFGEQHQMTDKCKRFYSGIGEAFPADYFVQNCDKDFEKISIEEVNAIMEAYVKNILTLIANKDGNMGSKIDIRTLDYSWRHFKHDIKGGIVNGKLKKPHLTERKKSLLIDMRKEKLDLPCAKDTYIYCAIALYYTKNIQERWK